MASVLPSGHQIYSGNNNQTASKSYVICGGTEANTVLRKVHHGLPHYASNTSRKSNNYCTLLGQCGSHRLPKEYEIAITPAYTSHTTNTDHYYSPKKKTWRSSAEAIFQIDMSTPNSTHTEQNNETMCKIYIYKGKRVCVTLLSSCFLADYLSHPVSTELSYALFKVSFSSLL